MWPAPGSSQANRQAGTARVASPGRARTWLSDKRLSSLDCLRRPNLPMVALGERIDEEQRQMRRRLTLPVLAWAVLGAGLARAVEILPLDQIRPGMTGVGRTVFEGARIEEFQVRILGVRSEEHTSELQSHSDLVCRLLLEKKKTTKVINGVANPRWLTIPHVQRSLIIQRYAIRIVQTSLLTLTQDVSLYTY